MTLSIVLLIIAAALGVGYVSQNFIRWRRLRNWPRTIGQIDSCYESGPADDGGKKEYSCVYIYSVDDTRNANSVTIVDKPDRLEEISAALIGEHVTVCYDPRNSMNSIIEESRIKDWNVC